MNRSPAPDSPKAAEEEHSPPAEENLSELRRLLLGPWQAEVDGLRHRLDDPGQHAAEVSGVLPEAVALSSGRDGRLAAALAPTVEEILKASVRKDPRTLVAALFPVMGPAIRKAIAETVKRMIQSFDQIIGQSFSWRGLKWRIEALRTGRPFGEVVLLHSLVYRVEQVFLIHRETGLLLQHVVAGSVEAQEPDMVSGMLTAIGDFVHDSFRTEGEEALNVVQLGELNLWVEQGPRAIVAGVIRGTPPEGLRQSFTEALELIHAEQRQALETFEGDNAPFEASRPCLEACLSAQYKAGGRRLSPITVLCLLALAAALAWWGWCAVQSDLRWDAYVRKLSAEPGIVVVETGKRHGQRFLSGLRDPLSKDPSDLLKEAGIDSGEVAFRWEPYYALNDSFVLARAMQLLNPPETVSLAFDKGILTVEGTASHQWIRELRGRLPALPGVVRIRETLADRDMEELEALKERLENTVLRFDTNSTLLLPDQGGILAETAAQAHRLQLLSALVHMTFRIDVVGHADSSGLEARNFSLSHKRADEIRSFLVSRGVDPAVLNAVGMGSKQPVREEASEQDRGFNRSVTLRPILFSAPRR
ncbi:MAG: OmpA family protein [Syntrophobacteraceae bacterium]|nr:OmpA family protein [Desulfobacteraceae bacterium]